MERETTIIVVVTLILVLIGVLMVYSTSAVRGALAPLFGMQLAYAALGLGGMYFLARFDYHVLRDPRVYRPLVFLSLTLLVLVLVVGEKVQGAQRWLRIGPFQFQPSEVAKVAVVVLLAVKLTQHQEQIRSFVRGFLPSMILASLFAGLIFMENDLGMPVVIMTVAFLMVFAAGVPLLYLLACTMPGVLGVLLACWTSEERRDRILAWRHPWDHYQSEGFHLIQSLAAFARGSIWGQGAGASEQKLYYLPAAHTDFIFAIWAEEMGLVGSLALVCLYAVLLVVAVRIAMCARDLFGALLATGIIGLVAFQSAFVMAVTTGILPTKGLPLPFISYGGTSLIVFLGLIGILINIGRQAHESEREVLAISGV